MSRERFDWSQDNADVVFRSYGDVAMHLNPYGDIVIRQDGVLCLVSRRAAT